jgi:hypothetical protein
VGILFTTLSCSITNDSATEGDSAGLVLPVVLRFTVVRGGVDDDVDVDVDGNGDAEEEVDVEGCVEWEDELEGSCALDFSQAALADAGALSCDILSAEAMVLVRVGGDFGSEPGSNIRFSEASSFTYTNPIPAIIS